MATRRLQASLRHALDPFGRQTGALVVDLSDDQTLFSVRATVRRPPASLEKLYTTVAVLRTLGPNARLHTVVLGTGSLRPGGVWRGNLYLRGDGDPTFGDGTFNHIYEEGYGPTATQLAGELHRAGLRRVTGRLYGDESRFDTDRGGPLTGNAPDLPDYGGELSALVFDHGATGPGRGPAVFAAHELALTMRAQKIFVEAASRTARTPRAARPLASVASPSMAVLLRLMDVPSDDLFADLLAKQLGFHFLGRGTLASGSIVIGQTLSTDYDLHPVIFDGSGLDRADRSSPGELVALLQKTWRTPTGRELAAALPIVGKTGTVASLGVGTPARGRCVAKTGTLNDVTNLAGLCTDRAGQQLAFALMVDGPPNWRALAGLSSAVGDLAGYR